MLYDMSGTLSIVHVSWIIQLCLIQFTVSPATSAERISGEASEPVSTGFVAVNFAPDCL